MSDRESTANRTRGQKRAGDRNRPLRVSDDFLFLRVCSCVAAAAVTSAQSALKGAQSGRLELSTKEGLAACALQMWVDSVLPFIPIRRSLPRSSTPSRRNHGCHDLYHADDPLRRPAQRGPAQDRSARSYVRQQAHRSASDLPGVMATPDASPPRHLRETSFMCWPLTGAGRCAIHSVVNCLRLLGSACGIGDRAGGTAQFWAFAHYGAPATPMPQSRRRDVDSDGCRVGTQVFPGARGD